MLILLHTTAFSGILNKYYRMLCNVEALHLGAKRTDGCKIKNCTGMFLLFGLSGFSLGFSLPLFSPQKSTVPLETKFQFNQGYGTEGEYSPNKIQ